jgi:hypothetical protein
MKCYPAFLSRGMERSSEECKRQPRSTMLTVRCMQAKNHNRLSSLGQCARRNKQLRSTAARSSRATSGAFAAKRESSGRPQKWPKVHSSECVKTCYRDESVHAYHLKQASRSSRTCTASACTALKAQRRSEERNQVIAIEQHKITEQMCQHNLIAAP